MSGLRISDSRPLSTEALVLCQKIDITIDGQRKRLPIFRECLRPGTEISFDLTVIPEEFPRPAEELLQAAERCRKTYDRCFRSAFPTRDIQQGGTVYLGGSCGYATKAFAYPLLGRTVWKLSAESLMLPCRVRRGHSTSTASTGRRACHLIC